MIITGLWNEPLLVIITDGTQAGIRGVEVGHLRCGIPATMLVQCLFLMRERWSEVRAPLTVEQWFRGARLGIGALMGNYIRQFTRELLRMPLHTIEMNGMLPTLVATEILTMQETF